mmetsp:Transcript_6742/g.9791  ORF Transcript_6742/g.9791 Transcript_6742/m.9791 type:complete len:433 (+) Transcript_6742:104-1402(+)
MIAQQPQQEVFLTSTTAPNKVFFTREELAQHYKSDCHKYNCKRKEAGLPLLNEEDFNARLQAALALKRELQEGRHKKDDHLKNKEKKRSTSKMHVQEKNEADVIMDEEEEETTAPPVVDPCQSLFDSTIHPNVNANVQYMQQKYGFFIPDEEYLINLTSLIGYCQEKIQIGQLCLYCQRGFRSPRAVKDHMVDSRHTKIRYEEGIDLWEYEPFYDFSEANKEFWDTWNGKKEKGKKEKKTSTATQPATSIAEDMNEMGESVCVIAEGDDDSTEWEDIVDDEEEEDSEEEYEEYATNLAQQGFDVTPLGELIFPDGRVVGHRLLARFYKQRVPNNSNVARRAAIMENRRDQWASANNINIVPRSQTGVIISKNGTAGGISAISLYRYKAVIKKSRREEARGKRLQQKTSLNMNRMGKKANRLMNNVSVAHAKR